VTGLIFFRAYPKILLLKTLDLSERCWKKGGKSMKDNAYEMLRPKIAGLTVNNLNNEAVAVDRLWQDRRVVLVFLRHYG
jgi:hypothetical protein